MEEEALEKADLRDQVPDLIPYLLPGERVISVTRPDIKASTQYPISTKALQRLTGAESFQDIGKFGPSVASRVIEANKDVAELRLFEVLFGRDSLRVALDVKDRYPQLLKSTILRLAELQGVKNNIKSEEEAGRIIHEARDPETDPIAKKLTEEKGWEWPFYASVDATPMFVTAIAEYSTHTQEGIAFLNEKFRGRDGQEHTAEDALGASLSWIKKRLDSNREGLLEYKAAFPGSHKNQVWKDSGDSYHHSDGTMANHEQGIASIEVQALAYDALFGAAELYEKKMESSEGVEKQKYAAEVSDLQRRAGNTKEQVMKNFWVEDERGGYFALGTDRDQEGNIRPLKIRTSNMGHLLKSRILDGDDPEVIRRKEAVIKTLFSEDLLASSGIRTLSNKEKRFRPGAYHNGNVWLWDTYYISQGLERHGYYKLTWDLNRRIWSVVDKYKKFPEFARGGNETEPMLNERIVDIWDPVNNRKNRIEQPPQEIQAWSVAALLDAKYKRGDQLLHRPEALPAVAVDPEKRKFEEQVLSSVRAKA